MPDYDYECEKCGVVFEVTQKMSDKPIKNCIKCDGKVKRLFGGGAGNGIIVKKGAQAVPCGKAGGCCGADSPCMRD